MIKKYSLIFLISVSFTQNIIEKDIALFIDSINNRTLDLEGDFTINGGTFNSRTGTHTISGNWDCSNGTFTSSTGQISMQGDNKTLNQGASNSFNNLLIDDNAEATLNSTTLDIDGNLQINSGATLDIASGATLANAGTATGFASIAWQSTVVTGATHTASANQGIWINTTSNACNLTLPGSPSVGDQVIFTDYARNWGTNAVTLNLNRVISPSFII